MKYILLIIIGFALCTCTESAKVISSDYTVTVKRDEYSNMIRRIDELEESLRSSELMLSECQSDRDFLLKSVVIKATEIKDHRR